MLKIAKVEQKHLIQITEIEKASRPTPWTEKQFASELGNAASHPRVLLEAETVIGYVVPWHIAGEIQIQNIVIAQTHRGRKLGELLLNYAINHGLAQGCTMAILEVRESNLPAIALYQKYQFEVVGKREGYYQDGETALLMSLEPLDSAEKRDAYTALIEKRADLLIKTHNLER